MGALIQLRLEMLSLIRVTSSSLDSLISRSLHLASRSFQVHSLVPQWLPDLRPIREELLLHASCISCYDQAVGNQLRTLQRAGELANTLLFATSGASTADRTRDLHEPCPPAAR